MNEYIFSILNKLLWASMFATARLTCSASSYLKQFTESQVALTTDQSQNVLSAAKTYSLEFKGCPRCPQKTSYIDEYATAAIQMNSLLYLLTIGILVAPSSKLTDTDCPPPSHFTTLGSLR